MGYPPVAKSATGQAVEPKPVPQVNQVQAKHDLEPSCPKTSDAALKLSELPGTDLPHPIGTPTMASTMTGSESSQTSRAMSVSQDTEPVQELTQDASTGSPLTAAALESATGPADPVYLMTKMHEMMQKLVSDVKTLKAENNELRALLG